MILFCFSNIAPLPLSMVKICIKIIFICYLISLYCYHNCIPTSSLPYLFLCLMIPIMWLFTPNSITGCVSNFGDMILWFQNSSVSFSIWKSKKTTNYRPQWGKKPVSSLFLCYFMTLFFIDKAANLNLKSFKQVEEVFSSGRWNVEVSLRHSARPIAKTPSVVWQQCSLSISRSLQVFFYIFIFYWQNVSFLWV